MKFVLKNNIMIDVDNVPQDGIIVDVNYRKILKFSYMN